MSSIPEVQRAVRALEGVAAATVRWPEPGGPATLRVEFQAEADRERLTGEILGILRDVGGVDLSTATADAPSEDEIRAEPEAASHPAAAGTGNGRAERSSGRAVFSAMSVHRTALESQVTVTLTMGERAVTGTADGLATRRAAPRTAAAATLSAVAHLLPDDVRLQLEWLEVLEDPHGLRSPLVQAAVTCLTPHAEELFVGSAMVQGDFREAAVRASLDAINRRLQQLVAA